jgi:hypothetical protein
VDTTTIGPWQATDVPPGVAHEFEAAVPTHLIEIYWTTLDPRDIDREVEGGQVESECCPMELYA